MSGIKFSWGLLVLFLLQACDTNDANDVYDTLVEKFIWELKANQYEEFQFPPLSAGHIPELLDSGGETASTKTFPHNPFVCFMIGEETKVGVVVLWTIESLRMSYLEGKKELIYPSADPLLIRKDMHMPREVSYSRESHFNAYDAYKTWWELNLPLAEKMKINPLEESEFKWR